MLSPKRAGRHPRAGTIYFWALVVAYGTMSALVIARWPANNHLGVLGTLALACATCLPSDFGCYPALLEYH